MKVYDAENQILGRMASVIAKQLLNGEKVVVVNCEKSILAGDKKKKVEFYAHRFERGDPIHGPFFPRQPDRIFRRTVRGMLPWDKTRGRNAYKNLKVFVGIPEEMKNSAKEKIKAAEHEKLRGRFTTLGEISQMIGAKKRW
jgi:large subunit ribosomal protein L13